MSARRQRSDNSSVCVKFSDGASLTLTFKGNLFDLTDAERQLMGALTNVIQKYEGLKQDASSAA